MQDFDPSQYGEADRREVDPPIQVQSATWFAGGTLDRWVKERRKWIGRVRGPDGRQRWIKLQIFVERKRPDHDAFVIRSSALRGVVIEVKAGVTSNHVSCNGRGLKTFDGQIDAQ
jgi:hypothetical protein